jgi:hypothetical protein
MKSMFYEHQQGSRTPQYAGSLKESSDAAPSHRTAAASGGIDVKVH